MAMAVQKLFPNSKVTIGPWIENGFYYDFDMEPLTDKDLKKIKKEMVSLHSCTEHVRIDLNCKVAVLIFREKNSGGFDLSIW
jgi:threonyl-tRNA synthetase